MRPAASAGQICFSQELVFLDVQLLCEVLVVAVMTIVECCIAKHLKPACAVFQSQVVVVVPLVVARCLAVSLDTEAVALRSECPDADHGIHLGIVLCTRCGDDIDVLDVIRLELLQFLGVAHLLVVDVNLWLALRQDGEFAIASLYHRQHRQQIVGRPHVMQERVLHLYRHSARSHPVLRHRTFHGHIADGVRLGLQCNGSQVFPIGA